MKQLTFASAFLCLTILSCQKADKTTETPEPEATLAERSCASYDVLQAQIAADPARGERLNAIEAFTQRAIANRLTERVEAGGDITIPVVVHVVYNTPEQNISDAQIASQIRVLNEDFNLRNKDHRLVPDHFSDLKADVGITFTLADVRRVQSNRKQWGWEDAVKYSTRGGSDAVDPSNYLNIWVCNLGQNLLGYAQFPGGNPATDGVVVLYSAFGDEGTLIANYNKGRTATHEVGHWLNLRHIWGDATCGDDGVKDTPQHNGPNYRCPTADHRSTCTGTPLEMWMNYMDYTYDGCMYMFSKKQKERMLALFTPDGSRASFTN